MSAQIFDFGVERAKRKSGIRDTALLEDMVAEGYDPCDPIDLQNYYEWQKFQNVIYTDVDIGNNWSEEALDRLFDDIKNIDTTKTYTVEYSIDELIAGDDFNLDFTTKPPKNT